MEGDQISHGVILDGMDIFTPDLENVTSDNPYPYDLCAIYTNGRKFGVSKI